MRRPDHPAIMRTGRVLRCADCDDLGHDGKPFCVNFDHEVVLDLIDHTWPIVRWGSFTADPAAMYDAKSVHYVAGQIKWLDDTGRAIAAAFWVAAAFALCFAEAARTKREAA
ncbi:MAG: hypothetical protein E6Q97_38555 [Desulfurellales bacterium]|nr:MAG: hypothetical protein E6Q97_38555 [Desulfurellales bacterium]